MHQENAKKSKKYFYCSKCGNAVEKTANFCGLCGKDLRNIKVIPNLIDFEVPVSMKENDVSLNTNTKCEYTKPSRLSKKDVIAELIKLGFPIAELTVLKKYELQELLRDDWIYEKSQKKYKL